MNPSTPHRTSAEVEELLALLGSIDATLDTDSAEVAALREVAEAFRHLHHRRSMIRFLRRSRSRAEDGAVPEHVRAHLRLSGLDAEALLEEAELEDLIGAVLPPEVEGVAIRAASYFDRDAIAEVASDLADWFTETGRANLAKDLPLQRCLVAEASERLLGFITFYAAQGVAQVGWMGVAPSHHRRGIGSALLAAAESVLVHHGVRELRVLTLGDAVDYEPYERTRAFYRARGFTDHRRTRTNDPEYPEELELSKRLGD